MKKLLLLSFLCTFSSFAKAMEDRPAIAMAVPGVAKGEDVADRLAKTEARGGNVNALEQEELVEALCCNNIQDVCGIMRRGFDVNSRLERDNGQYWTYSLHLAAYLGHGAIVQLLLDNGADVKRRNSSGKTASDVALGLAPPYIRPDICELLENARSRFQSSIKGAE